MADINSITVSGRLVSEPAVKDTKVGKLAELRLAIDGYGSKVIFIDVTIWGDKGEKAGELLKQGSYIYLTGRLVQEEWESKGVKKIKYSISTNDFSFMPSNKKEEKTFE